MSNEELMAALMERLGGPHAVIEQMSKVLESASSSGANENTPGYCYLRLFDRVEHRDAAKMGPTPTVADLRRFSNGRADPFGTRGVTVKVLAVDGERVAHVAYDSGVGGLRPVAALAALAKDLRVGGLPDGVSEDFPPEWVPHDLAAVQTWDFRSGPLDVLSWIGDRPPWLSQEYEAISHPTSRVRWVVKAEPLGPNTGTIDVIDPNGKVITAKSWTSHVAPVGYHQGWQVRGRNIFAEAYVWRAARFIKNPQVPLPTPPPADGHTDLLVVSESNPQRRARATESADIQTHIVGPHPLLTGADGYCYTAAFVDAEAAARALGPYPTVGEVLEHSVSAGVLVCDATLQPRATERDGVVVHHVTNREGSSGLPFWENILSLPPKELLGATQSDAVNSPGMENFSQPAHLTLRPRGNGMLMSIPFVAILEVGQEEMFWDLSAGKKLNALMGFFESVEMVSLRIKVTVLKGDNDTLVSVIADTFNTRLTKEEDWVGAAHTLHLAGNTNGATSGEFVLEGNHGFGTQLKGVSVGNATPIIQAKLDTAVVAKAYLKAVLTVRVSGTGVPVAMAIPTMPTKGG